MDEPITMTVERFSRKVVAGSPARTDASRDWIALTRSLDCLSRYGYKMEKRGMSVIVAFIRERSGTTYLELSPGLSFLLVIVLVVGILLVKGRPEAVGRSAVP